jgi:hypothetical protein
MSVFEQFKWFWRRNPMSIVAELNKKKTKKNM